MLEHLDNLQELRVGRVPNNYIAVYSHQRGRFVIMAEREATRCLIGHEDYATRLFEGVRVYEHDGVRHVFRWGDHSLRLFAGLARSLEIEGRDVPFTEDQLQQAMLEVVALNRQDSYIRPSIYVSDDIKVYNPDFRVMAYVATRDWHVDKQPYLGTTEGQGVSGLITNIKRNPPQDLTFAKGAWNYPASFKARRRALLQEYEDGGLRNATGELFSEFSGMNGFMRFGNRLWTPGLESSALAGITRDTVIEIARRSLKLETIIGPIPVETFFYESEEVFSTGTATEVSVFDRLGLEGPWTKGVVSTRDFTRESQQVSWELKKLYRQVVTGQTFYNPGWYLPVPELATAKV